MAWERLEHTSSEWAAGTSGSSLNEGDVNLHTDSLDSPSAPSYLFPGGFWVLRASLATIVLLFMHCKGSALTRDLFEIWF